MAGFAYGGMILLERSNEVRIEHSETVAKKKAEKERVQKVQIQEIRPGVAVVKNKEQ